MADRNNNLGSSGRSDDSISNPDPNNPDLDNPDLNNPDLDRGQSRGRGAHREHAPRLRVSRLRTVTVPLRIGPEKNEAPGHAGRFVVERRSNYRRLARPP